MVSILVVVVMCGITSGDGLFSLSALASPGLGCTSFP